MSYKIRNWEKFQHYKQRTPPWIKVYRSLLDEPEFYELSGDAAKTLIYLWLIASEKGGYLPDSKVLAFRLRMDINTLESYISELKNYIASTTLAQCEQNACLETETDTEVEKEIEGKARERAKEYPGLVALLATEWPLPGNAPVTRWARRTITCGPHSPPPTTLSSTPLSTPLGENSLPCEQGPIPS